MSSTTALGTTPNIVILMTDQQRQGFTAGEGFGLDTMPFCDSLGTRGRRFTHAYTPMPACVPARTSLLTGRFPSTHHVRQNSTPQAVVRGIDLVDLVRQAGYRTAFVGKPHMYRGAADFDHWAGPYMHTGAPEAGEPEQAFTRWLKGIDHGPATEATPFGLEVQYPYRITSDAVDIIDQHDTKNPLFCWVSFPEPHNPYQVPEPYWSMFPPDEVPDRGVGPEGADAKGGSYRWLRELIEEKRPDYDTLWRRYRASYCGMMRLIDDQVRRLVEAVYAKLGDNTVIVYLADHGDYVGEYGLQRKGAGMPEVLMRIPFFVTGPGIQAAHDDRSMVSLVDLLPTVAEMVGAEIPLGVQGRSLWPLLSGVVDHCADLDSVYAEGGFGGLPYPFDARPELHFPYAGTVFDELNTVTQSGTTRMLRRGRWKLLFHVSGTGELYDLDNDPLELTNLWADEAARTARTELVQELLWWTMRVSDDLPHGNYSALRPQHNLWR